MSSIRIYGVAIFSLRKDPDVALLDLQVAGIRNMVRELDEEHLKLITIVEREFAKILPHKTEHIDYIGEMNRRTLLVRMYRDEEGKVNRVLVVALRGGALRALSRRLERLGWHRMLLFEIRKIMHKAHVDNP